MTKSSLEDGGHVICIEKTCLGFLGRLQINIVYFCQATWPFLITLLHICMHIEHKASRWVEVVDVVLKLKSSVISSLAADGSGALAGTQSRTGLFDESFTILRDSLHANTIHVPKHE